MIRSINRRNPPSCLENEFPSIIPTFVDEFYEIPSSCHVSKSSLYFNSYNRFKNGQIFSMELTSALAVECLELQSHDHFLDLCCAPGMKLCLAANRIGPLGSITGVDISLPRLYSARSQVKKYKLQRTRLFHADSTNFDVKVYIISPDVRTKKLESSTGKKPFFVTTDIRKFPGHIDEQLLYDKVLVDAECTHDGSIKHVQKQMKNQWRDFDCSLFSESRLKTLYKMQYELLQNAFSLLKPKGILVYSTCSLTYRQNEEIISSFLANNSNCMKVNINFPPFSNDDNYIRIDPFKMRMGALFIAKLTKVE